MIFDPNATYLGNNDADPAVTLTSPMPYPFHQSAINFATRAQIFKFLTAYFIATLELTAAATRDMAVAANNANGNDLYTMPEEQFDKLWGIHGRSFLWERSWTV